MIYNSDFIKLFSTIYNFADFWYFIRKRFFTKNGVYEDEQENKVSIFSGSFRYFAPLVIKAIETGDTSLISTSASFEDALYNLKVLDAIKLSANKGEAVVLGKETNTYV